MRFEFKKVEQRDWKTLLQWRNNSLTKEMSLNKKKITLKEHLEYMSEIKSNKKINQFLFIHLNNKIGTLKEDFSDNSIKYLSYTINPKYRKKGYGNLMMYLYLFENSGTFVCEVKKNNIASINMCERNNFILHKEKQETYIYKLKKNEKKK